MFSLAVLLVATVVLLVVVPLLVRELRLWKEAGRGEVDVDVRALDIDVTKVGVAVLPKLSVLPEREANDSGSYSTAMTTFEVGAEVDEPTASKKFILVWASGETHQGQRRARNEDAILLMPDHSTFAIADGMGGYAGGEVASRLAVEAVERSFRAPSLHGTMDERRPLRAQELVWAIENANQTILEVAAEDPRLERMGATFVGARFAERKQRAFIGHVGDSRCYRLRGDTLRLLTADHTLAARGVKGPLGARVRRALGVSSKVRVDLCVDRPLPDDIYLLCSDGLNKMLNDDEIASTVLAYRHDLDAAVRELVDRANAAGGRDNISVVLIGVRSVADAA